MAGPVGRNVVARQFAIEASPYWALEVEFEMRHPVPAFACGDLVAIKVEIANGQFMITRSSIEVHIAHLKQEQAAALGRVGARRGAPRDASDLSPIFDAEDVAPQSRPHPMRLRSGAFGARPTRPSVPLRTTSEGATSRISKKKTCSCVSRTPCSWSE